jgi:hypothetical protein
MLLAMDFIELLDIAKLFALLTRQDGIVPQIRNQLVGPAFLGVDMSALINARQERAAPLSRPEPRCELDLECRGRTLKLPISSKLHGGVNGGTNLFPRFT